MKNFCRSVGNPGSQRAGENRSGAGGKMPDEPVKPGSGTEHRQGGEGRERQKSRRAVGRGRGDSGAATVKEGGAVYLCDEDTGKDDGTSEKLPRGHLLMEENRATEGTEHRFQ